MVIIAVSGEIEVNKFHAMLVTKFGDNPLLTLYITFVIILKPIIEN